MKNYHLPRELRAQRNGDNDDASIAIREYRSARYECAVTLRLLKWELSKSRPSVTAICNYADMLKREYASLAYWRTAQMRGLYGVSAGSGAYNCYHTTMDFEAAFVARNYTQYKR